MRPLSAVVLAAGEGTRMRSERPKPLHRLCGRPMVLHVLDAIAELDVDRAVVVVGHGAERVTKALGEQGPPGLTIEYVDQAVQAGTGDAASVAMTAFAGDDDLLDDDDEADIIVLPGDTPLLRSPTLAALVRHHRTEHNTATVLTAKLHDPTGYGRIVRRRDDRVERIVEHKDASAEQREIDEINVGIFVFRRSLLAPALRRLSPANAQGEYYLTDTVEVLAAAGHRVGTMVMEDPMEAAGINDRAQLAAAAAVLRTRRLTALMVSGVTVVDPATTYVDVDVVCEPDVTLLPGTSLLGRTVVQRGAVVGPWSTLTDTTVRPGAVVESSTCRGAEIGPDSSVGPYAFLRPGTRLGRRAKVGAYVETKNAVIGDDSKVPHLAYAGDVVIGARSNVGAGTIVVNYDGVAKHRSILGDDVRVGSNNSLVSPVHIGDRAYTAAGSVITSDVPAAALGVGRALQRNIEGWVTRRRGTGTGTAGHGGEDAT